MFDIFEKVSKIDVETISCKHTFLVNMMLICIVVIGYRMT
jgi:hypothetical protein